MLDNKAINEVTRTFLKSLDRIKSEQKQKSINLSNNDIKNIEIDLRKDLPLLRSDGTVFDVSNIISEAIDENNEKPWIIFQDSLVEEADEKI